MASAQPKYDPSMEELLASIRRIISEDDDQPNAMAHAGSDQGLEAAFAAQPEDDFGGLDPATLPDLIEQSIREAFPADEQPGSWGQAEMDAFSAALVAEDEEADDEPVYPQDLAPRQDNLPADWNEASVDWGAPSEPVDSHSFEPFSRPAGFAPEPEPVRPAPVAEAPTDFAEPDAQEIRRLLSERSEAAAGFAFDSLARRTEAPASRSLEDVVQDCLRPMLQDWMDRNLPPIVERMVQQEIDRVARRR